MMEKRKTDKHKNSILSGFRLGKDKKSKSAGYTQRETMDDYGFVTPSGQSVDVESIAEYEVSERFEQMLDDMNLTEEKKAPIRGRDMSFKRNMLSMHFRGAAKAKGSELDNPHTFVNELRNPDLRDERRLRVLETLRVSLTSKPISWVAEFGEKGLNAVLRNLTFCCDNKTERRSIYECVRCLKAYMNNKFGLKQILDHEEALTILSRTVDPTDPPTMLEAVRLLAAICLVPPNGHEKVLEGITVCGEICNQERFVPFIMGMGMKDNEAMQVACIQLVNAVISTAEDLDLRLHLRNEILRTGMNDLIEFLDVQDEEEFKTHLCIFYEHTEEDFEEFSHRYDNIRMEFDDPESCFKMLLGSVKDTIAEPYFLSILQHLLSIRDDMFARPQYYKLVEECVTQIVLHRSGVDPDFRHTKRFVIDVEPLLSNLTEKSKIEDSQVSVTGLNSKLERALIDKQEAEAKVSSLETKVFQYEAEIKQLRDRVNQTAGEAVSDVLTKQLIEAGDGVHLPPPPLPESSKEPPLVPPPPPPPPPPPLFGQKTPSLPGGVPPPPPPPGMGLPPPPQFHGSGGAVFSPPAGQLPHGMKPKKKYDVKAQTKRLNWNKLNAKNLDKNSVWARADETRFEDINVFYDLASMFSTKAPVRSEACIEEVKSSRKGKELRVLDGKSGQNLSILLGSIKLPYTEIKRRILSCDWDNLTTAVLEQLIKNMPESGAMNQLAEMKCEYDQLAEAEQFIIVMSSIKRVRQRLESMLFYAKFSELVDDLKPDLVCATEACCELLKSDHFRNLLELVLLLGNYLNTGSRNAQSIGFDVSFLPKLDNTKSVDGKTTLMHFLAHVIEENHPAIMTFTDDLIHTNKAARVSMEMMQKNLKAIEKQIKHVETDVKTIGKGSEDGDRFPTVMKEFLGSAKGQHDLLTTMYKRLDNLHRDLAKYLAFDAGKYSIEELFLDIKTFKDGFQRAVKDNIRIRETQEKIRRAKEAKEKAERERLEKRARQKALLDLTTDDDQEGVMDNLLEALKTGSAFNVRDKRDGRRRTPRAAGAERRAQLSRTRSRQDLFDDDVTGYNRVLDKNPTESKESGVTETVTAAMERVRRCPKNSHDDEFQAEQILARLRQL